MKYPPEHPTPLLTTREIDARIRELRDLANSLIRGLYRGIVAEQIVDLMHVRDLAHERERAACAERGHALKWVAYDPILSSDRPFLICDRCGKYARNVIELYDQRFTYDPETLDPSKVAL